MAGLEKCANGYCEIPGGTFQMGSTNGNPDERPVRNVTMTGFQLGQTEVSVSDYKAYCRKRDSGLYEKLKSLLFGDGWGGLRKCISYHPENQKGGNFPVVNLSFDEKRAYCKAQGGDLPTAAQLHYASRFDDQDSATGKLVINGYSVLTTAPANRGYKNRFGVHNLLGNVWESALDAYDENFYARMAAKDPYNPLTNQHTQFEEFSGGGYYSFPTHLRSAARRFVAPYGSHGDVGFRCARPLPKDSKKVK
jgi:formylglycine-generating enzyme required for sulfatase activity